MSKTVEDIEKFVAYVDTLKGDEKGESQVFCDRLFQAFGHAGYKEAGATLEERVKAKGKSTKFADLVWKPRLLLEMKKRGEKLQNHTAQAFEYWMCFSAGPTALCGACAISMNFGFTTLIFKYEEPIDKVPLAEMPRRYQAFNFLFPADKPTAFQQQSHQSHTRGSQ